jgi:hypothetical protein
MGTVKILVHITKPLKAKLDALRAEGTTASGLIRRLLTQHFNPPTKGQKGR